MEYIVHTFRYTLYAQTNKILPSALHHGDELDIYIYMIILLSKPNEVGQKHHIETKSRTFHCQKTYLLCR